MSFQRFEMTGALDVGMRKLVDEDQRGFTRERGVQIELLELRAAIREGAGRQYLELSEQRCCFGPPMGFDNADDYVGALGLLFARFGEHRVRLAHTCRGTEENLQPAALALSLLALDSREQRIRIGTLFGHRCGSV